MADYEVSEEAKGLVKQLEGFSDTAYPDASGHSIGYGHFIKPGEEGLLNEKLAPEKAEELLKEDIKTHQKPWIGDLNEGTPENVVTALTSFAYNVGPYSTGLSRAIDAINSGDVNKAANIMAEYNKSYDPKVGAKVTNAALVARREFEGKILRGEKVDVKEVKNFSSKGVVRSTVDFFKNMFGKPTGPNFCTAAASDSDAMGENAAILQELRVLNRELKSASAESDWIRRLKQEGSGLWAAQ